MCKSCFIIFGGHEGDCEDEEDEEALFVIKGGINPI